MKAPFERLGDKGTERHTPSMVPLHDGSGLAEDALVRKDFGVPLQSQVVVPRRGELLVLFLKLKQRHIMAVDDGSGDLLHGTCAES